jgi:hypothetical protein
VTYLRWLAPAALVAGTLAAQVIHLKTRDFDPAADRTAYLASPLKRRTPGTSHYLVQFDGPVSAEIFHGLVLRGIAVTGLVPPATVMIAAPDDFSLAGLPVRWVGRLEQRDKISRLLCISCSSTHLRRGYVVEFHSDVDMDEGRAMVREHGLRLIENPSLAAHDLLVTGSFGNLSRLSSWDAVAYIYPASPELMACKRVYPCAGAISQQTTVAQYAGTGYPWPVSGTEGLTLGYVFSQLTAKLPAAATKAEFLRAFNEWSRNANVNFVSGTNAEASQTINILFATGDHGDGYPFNGPGGILAHTFYPAPPNPEPIAADLHLNDSERWQIGADSDVFSVVLHEAGHSLGLVHTDDPSDVMYPYYRMHSALGAGDIAVAQAMYGVRNGPVPASPLAPLVLIVNSPAATFTTTASSASLSGSTSGGAAPIKVTWQTAGGYIGNASGTPNWTIAAVPLSLGANVITITAVDAAGHTATQSISVIQQPPAPVGEPTTSPTPPASPSDTTPPSLLITYPASTILATGASTISFQGLATDNVGVTSVTWSNSAGTAGYATGLVNWVTPSIPLLEGNNTITIKAFDAAGNSAWRSVTVVRQ